MVSSKQMEAFSNPFSFNNKDYWVQAKTSFVLMLIFIFVMIVSMFSSPIIGGNSVLGQLSFVIFTIFVLGYFVFYLITIYWMGRIIKEKRSTFAIVVSILLILLGLGSIIQFILGLTVFIFGYVRKVKKPKKK